MDPASRLASRILYEALFAPLDQPTLGHGANFSGPGAATRDMADLLAGATRGLRDLVWFSCRGTSGASPEGGSGTLSREAAQEAMIGLFPYFADNHVDAVLELAARSRCRGGGAAGAEDASSAPAFSDSGFSLGSRDTAASASPAKPSPGPLDRVWFRCRGEAPIPEPLRGWAAKRQGASARQLLQPPSPIPRRPARKPHSNAAGSPRARRCLSPKWAEPPSALGLRGGPGAGGEAEGEAGGEAEGEAGGGGTLSRAFADLSGRVFEASTDGVLRWRLVGGEPGGAASRPVCLRAGAVLEPAPFGAPASPQSPEASPRAVFRTSMRLYLVRSLSHADCLETQSEIYPGFASSTLRSTDGLLAIGLSCDPHLAAFGARSARPSAAAALPALAPARLRPAAAPSAAPTSAGVWLILGEGADTRHVALEAEAGQSGSPRGGGAAGAEGDSMNLGVAAEGRAERAPKETGMASEGRAERAPKEAAGRASHEGGAAKAALRRLRREGEMLWLLPPGLGSAAPTSTPPLCALAARVSVFIRIPAGAAALKEESEATSWVRAERARKEAEDPPGGLAAEPSPKGEVKAACRTLPSIRVTLYSEAEMRPFA